MFAEEDYNEDYDGEGEVGFSFEQLEKQEAEKSTRSLKDLDAKLYSAHDPIVETTMEEDDSDNLRKYYSAGYDANYDGVEDKEILQWRRTFPYLDIVGHKLPLPVDSDCVEDVKFDNIPPTVNMNSYRESGTFIFDDTLVVVGKAMTIHSGYMNSDGGDSEVFLEDGVLDEIIAIDNTSDVNCDSNPIGDSLDLNDANLCCCPSTTQREEVVSTLFSMIWPDIVKGLEPIVEKVVRLAKDNNINLEEYERACKEDCEVKVIGQKRQAEFLCESDNDFDFNQDDEW